MLKTNNDGNIIVEHDKPSKEPYICPDTGAHFKYDDIHEKLMLL